MEAEQGLPFGLDKVFGKSPGVFHDWNKVPLLKRMFSVAPNRHTKTLLDAYKLQREIKKRVNELNKYAPEKTSPIKEQIVDIAARGRYIGLSLIGAQQFASQIDSQVYGNCSVKVVGVTDDAELSKEIYRFLGVFRDAVRILQKGQLAHPTPYSFVSTEFYHGIRGCLHGLFPFSA